MRAAAACARLTYIFDKMRCARKILRIFKIIWTVETVFLDQGFVDWFGRLGVTFQREGTVLRNFFFEVSPLKSFPRLYSQRKVVLLLHEFSVTIKIFISFH